MIRNIVVVCSLIIFALISCGNSQAPREELGERLLKEAAPRIFTLTPPSAGNHGGTGFLAKMPSGRTLMVSNRHVCEVAENGLIAAHYPDNPSRSTVIKVIESSSVTDLCLLEGIPGIEGMPVAKFYNPKKRIAVVGHPRLQPATFTEGYAYSRETVKAMEPVSAKECKQKIESIDTLFGPIPVCVEELEAWKSTVVILPGSSGSPVFNAEAEIVGVMFAGEEETHWGIFVPIEDLKAFISIY